jgi:phosphohistidine phosphatase SixA
MQIVLVRHADAEPESATTLADFGRALTPLGRRQARDTAVWLASSLKGPLHLFLTSPLVRTVQTAEICAGALPGATVAVAESLRSGQTTMAQMALVRGLKASTGLVGHEPNMSELASALLERRSLPLSFAKGACLLIDVHPEGFEFVSYRAPFGNLVTSLS